MNNEKTIMLTFDLGEVCNDILASCNLISQGIKEVALEDIKANVQQPDNPETRSIICRGVSEAVGKVKVGCQRYLMSGRTTDSNDLERLVKDVTYAKVWIQDSNESGYLLYTCMVRGVASVVYKVQDIWIDNATQQAVTPDAPPAPKMVQVDSDDVGSITYESVVLTLKIPNFNTAVTDHLKSMIHKYIVDWTMYRFLQDQLSDKASEYKGIAEDEDYVNMVKDLNCRERYTMRKPSFM